MGNKSRMPYAIPAFGLYFSTFMNYLLEGIPQTNAARLGITEEELADLQVFLNKWDSLYPTYVNKDATRTNLGTRELHLVRQQVSTYDQTNALLNRIASSPNVTLADLSVFNIKSGVLVRATRSKPSSPIEALVMPGIRQIGGGSLAIKCGNNLDTRRGIVEDASCVEYRYQIGGEAPQSISELGHSGQSTRAAFTLALDADHAGKTVYITFRWFNPKYPALAGPWCNIIDLLLV